MSKRLEPLEALCYLDDIAHGRKMKLDPHELKLIVEKGLEGIKELKMILLNDLDTYETLLIGETQEFMRHYYQGKIDYISQLSARLNLEVFEQL